MSRRAGFTLIELMIVVVIIGILAAVAIPKFQAVSRDAKAAEAQPLLKQVYTLENRYQARYGSYTTEIGALEGGSTLPTSGRFFSYSVVDHDSGFCVVATPTAAGTTAGLDPQSLDAASRLHLSSDCS